MVYRLSILANSRVWLLQLHKLCSEKTLNPSSTDSLLMAQKRFCHQQTRNVDTTCSKTWTKTEDADVHFTTRKISRKYHPKQRVDRIVYVCSSFHWFRFPIFKIILPPRNGGKPSPNTAPMSPSACKKIKQWHENFDNINNLIEKFVDMMCD